MQARQRGNHVRVTKSRISASPMRHGLESLCMHWM